MATPNVPTELGRLLDRAAGALSASHPDLAAELTAAADTLHVPDDPFDTLTGDADVDTFRTFGYLVLRGFFDQGTVAKMRDEVEGAMRSAYGDAYDDRLRTGGMDGHYLNLLGPWAPCTVGVVEDRRLVHLAERLLGGWVLPSPGDTQGILYFDHAGWHNDTGIAVRGAKFVAYLDPLSADTGALRVLPGSHRLTDAQLGRLHAPEVRVPDVPGQVVATEPGDVIVFDPFVWHASWGGRDRLQWTTLYLRTARTPPEFEALLAWYREGLDYDGPDGFGPFDRDWVAGGSGDVPDKPQRHRWMYRLRAMGVLDLYGVADAFRN